MCHLYTIERSGSLRHYWIYSIAVISDPLGAEAYHVPLLKRGRGHIQWHANVTGAFLVAPTLDSELALGQHIATMRACSHLTVSFAVRTIEERM
jgi:hypothetical protein